MHILSIRREAGGGSTLARFDVQLTPDLRLLNLKLIDAPRGRRVYAPSAFGTNTATFAPALASALVRAAEAALESENANDRRND